MLWFSHIIHHSHMHIYPSHKLDAELFVHSWLNQFDSCSRLKNAMGKVRQVEWSTRKIKMNHNHKWLCARCLDIINRIWKKTKHYRHALGFVGPIFCILNYINLNFQIRHINWTRRYNKYNLYWIDKSAMLTQMRPFYIVHNRIAAHKTFVSTTNQDYARPLIYCLVYMQTKWISYAHHMLDIHTTTPESHIWCDQTTHKTLSQRSAFILPNHCAPFSQTVNRNAARISRPQNATRPYLYEFDHFPILLLWWSWTLGFINNI